MGPLAGLKVIELGGIGPVPFAAMLLADMGATVIRVDRVGEVGTGDRATDPLLRNRQSVAVNLKDPDGAAVILRMVARADALIEGFRPGVAERLGLGPPECLETNPALVYGRMTGWGQEGPLAASAGHDLNYLALAGVLGMIGPAGGAPTVPLNLIADFGGGGMLLALGVLGAVLESRSSGRGQVVDAAMVDGAALLSTMIHGFRAQGLWTDERGANLLDGGAPFYGVYETADGEFLTIAPIEPAFFGELVERVGLTGEVPDQFDQSGWPELRRRLEEAFAARTLAEWQEALEGTDVCFAPVLSVDEAAAHPHNLARETFIKVAGVLQPAPAPRFSRTSTDDPVPPVDAGADTAVVLAGLGLSSDEIAGLLDRRVIA
ncbi:MAG: CoA transferase [Acidimicrobiia bacterium]|nr:MAG: CoA transferase [Acidimicrobiia bacterium]